MIRLIRLLLEACGLVKPKPTGYARVGWPHNNIEVRNTAANRIGREMDRTSIRFWCDGGDFGHGGCAAFFDYDVAHAERVEQIMRDVLDSDPAFEGYVLSM